MSKVTFTKDFFIAITKLFYATAMADKSMPIEEKKNIVEVIKQDWTFLNLDFNSEELMYDTMKSLIKNKTSSDIVFNEFSVFVSKHHYFFSKEISYKLNGACKSICNAFNDTNKSELIILTKIKKLLN